jgi:predicted ATPase
MLRKINLTRFKALSQTADVNLSDFSILCGSNSSGKSSFIQALLMLGQTFGARYDQGSMVLNGDLVRLGTFSDIRTHFADGDTIEIGFTICRPVAHYGLDDVKSIECVLNFGQKTVKSGRISNDLELHPPINSISITLQKEADGVLRSESIFVQRQPSSDDSGDADTSLYQVVRCTLSDMEDIAKQYPQYSILGCERDFLIPNVLHIEYDHTRKLSSRVISAFSGTNQIVVTPDDLAEDVVIPKALLDEVKQYIILHADELAREFDRRIAQMETSQVNQLASRALESIRIQFAKTQMGVEPSVMDPILEEASTGIITLQRWLSYLRKLDAAKRKTLSDLIDRNRAKLQEIWYNSSPRVVQVAHPPLRSMFYLGHFLRGYFSRSMRYLGPLRNEPQAVYTSLGHSDPMQVGLKGEYTAAALHINRQREIFYPSPITTGTASFEFREKKASVEIACKEWLSYLGVLSDYKTVDRGKLGFEIQVKTNAKEKWQDLTHVGVGVSQVLPIVLMLLLSQPQDLLLFEQPELHLHPKMQSRLCDFFIAMSAAHRQCFIETHSEYLINRLRLRIAQSRDEKVKDGTKVFFVKKVDGVSHLSEVAITKFGVIPDWPEDFFDQTDAEIEQILVEANQKRKEEKKGHASTSPNL